MGEQKVKLGVFGLGKLGLCTALGFSKAGYDVLGFDIDSALVDKINAKESPIQEPSVAEFLREHPIEATTDFSRVKGRAASFVVVPTPSTKDGSFDPQYVRSAIKSIKEGVGGLEHVISVVSTLTPGTMAKLEKEVPTNISLVYSPEFIALGSVLQDFLNPDVVLIGERSAVAGGLIEEIYANTVENNAAVVRMITENAEIAKVALNSYVTMKINFANTLAEICENVPNGDVDSVTGLLGLDRRIGGHYLKGGVPYGGPCFPRDNRAFHQFAKSLGVSAGQVMSTHDMNEYQVERLKGRVVDIIGDVEGRRVAVLGLSYKPHTDVVEESAGQKLVDFLQEQGAVVKVYDKNHYGERITKVLEGTDLAVIALPDDEFTTFGRDVFVDNMATARVLDCWRIRPDLKGDDGIEYHAIGEYKE